MEIWNNIVHNAMLGTGRLSPDKKRLSWPGSLPDYPTPPDAETHFLQLATVAAAYMHGGTQPLQPNNAHIEEAAPEVRPYCSSSAATLLTNIVQQEVPVLFGQWMQMCALAQQIIPPDLLPMVLQKGKEWKQYRAHLAPCMGNRGLWLAALNADWHYALQTANVVADEDSPMSTVWQEGATAARVQLLAGVRMTNAAMGRQMVMDTWAAENAAARADMLRAMINGLEQADLEWLETLTNEKSQKVREAAYMLLKLLRGSSVAVLYQKLLQESVTITTEKALLGLVKKTVLRVTPPQTITEHLLRTGIQKSASDKMTEEEHALWQVIASVHPDFWIQHLALQAAGVIEQFKKDASQYLSALANAICLHKEPDWAVAYTNAGEKHLAMIPLLPSVAQEQLLLTAEPGDIPWAKHTTGEWSEKLATHLLRMMAQIPYQYSRAEMKEYVHLIPTALIGKAATLNTQNDYYQIVWVNTCTVLDSWLQVKKELKNIFK